MNAFQFHPAIYQFVGSVSKAVAASYQELARDEIAGLIFVWFGLVWSGLVWFGLSFDWFGLFWLGLVNRVNAFWQSTICELQDELAAVLLCWLEIR